MIDITSQEISGFELLKGLDDKQRTLFLAHLAPNFFPAGKEVFHVGEKGGEIYFLISGEVEISQSLTLSINKHADYDTREKSIVRLTGDDGAVFGELSLFGREERRTATVTALTDCRMARMPGKQFFKILDEHLDIGYRVMQNLTAIVCDRLVTANENVLKLTTALSLVLER